MKPEIHTVFTEDGYWLGDFPNPALAEAYQELVRQLDAQLNRPKPKTEPVRDQYDADRLGV